MSEESTALSPMQTAAVTEVGELGKLFKMQTPGDVLADVLISTAFSGNDPPTPAQLVALVVVARQYRLNPFTKEIYAYPDKNRGIVPIVGVDGWSRIINEHKAFDGMEFHQSENMVKVDADAKEAPEWMECVMYRKDRTHPIIIREYIDEVYRPAIEKEGRNGKYKVNTAWQTHTKRFFRHKTMIQAARVAFGFAGIYDQDEAERIIEGGDLAAIEVAERKPPSRPKARSQQRRPAGPDDSDGPDDGTPKREQTLDEGRMADHAAGLMPEREEDIADAEFTAVDEQENVADEPDRHADEPERFVGQPGGEDRWEPQPGQASKGMIDFIKRKAESKGYTEGDLLERFELTSLRGISEAKGEEILSWAKTRPDKEPVA